MQYGYRSYGKITIAEMTRLVEGVMGMTFAPGEHSMRLPQAASFNTLTDAEGILGLFAERARQMGWTITDSVVSEVHDGFVATVAFIVPEGAPFDPTQRFGNGDEEKTSPWLIGLGVLGGVALLEGIVYFGTR